MPSPLWLTTPELSIARAELGGPIVEVALPYRGLTPYRWRIAAIRGAELTAARRRPPIEGGVGAGGFELFTLAASDAAEVVFALQDLAGEIVERRTLHIDR